MVIHESQHHHDDGTSIELDNHVNDGKLNINRSFDTMEEEVDDSMMFSQKFLLQSTFPDEKTITMDETCRFSFSRDVLANTDDIPTNGESRFILMYFFHILVIINCDFNYKFLIQSFWNLQLRYKLTVEWIDVALELIEWEQALDLKVFSHSC